MTRRNIAMNRLMVQATCAHADHLCSKSIKNAARICTVI